MDGEWGPTQQTGTQDCPKTNPRITPVESHSSMGGEEHISRNGAGLSTEARRRKAHHPSLFSPHLRSPFSSNGVDIFGVFREPMQD